MSSATRWFDCTAIVYSGALLHCSLIYDADRLDKGGSSLGALDGSTDSSFVDSTLGPDAGYAEAPVERVPEAEGSAGGELFDAAPQVGIDTGMSAPPAGTASLGGSGREQRAAASGDAAGSSDAEGGGAVVDASPSPSTKPEETPPGDAAVVADSDSDANGPCVPSREVATDGGSLAVGLVADYRFDEAIGTTSSDLSGNCNTATMVGATFSSGVTGNAATMNGKGQYVRLPAGIVSTLIDFSIAAWVRVNVSQPFDRLFDFGSGTNQYMYFTPSSPGRGFGISINTPNAEQDVYETTALPSGRWQHVAITLQGSTGTLYISGVQVQQVTTLTLTPARLGVTMQNWLGRSQFPADPYFNGQIDNFRIYNRALSPAEVDQLFVSQE